MSQRREGLVLAAVAAAIIVADIATKQWALAALKNQSAYVLLPVLRLVYVENTGVAFGMLGDSSRWFLIAVALILMVILLYYLSRAAHAGERWACVLMLSGALGNTFDRLLFGYVIDFIDVHWQQYHYPAFNVADIAISLGGLCFAYFILFFARK